LRHEITEKQLSDLFEKIRVAYRRVLLLLGNY
jgi:hypothetical protein